jgi:hypothetical protein
VFEALYSANLKTTIKLNFFEVMGDMWKRN